MIETKPMIKVSEWIDSGRPIFTKTKSYRYENKEGDGALFRNIKGFDKVSDKMKLCVENKKSNRNSSNCWRMMLTSSDLNCFSEYEYIFTSGVIKKRSITLTLPIQVLLEVGEWYTLRMDAV